MRFNSITAAPSGYRAVFVDVGGKSPEVFFVDVPVFAIVEDDDGDTFVSPMVPGGQAGLWPAMLMDGYVDCADESLSDEEYWLDQWRLQSEEDEDEEEEEEPPAKKKKPAANPKRKVAKKAKPAVEEESSEEEEEDDDDDDDDDDDEPSGSVHVRGR